MNERASSFAARVDALKQAYPYQFARMFQHGLSIDVGWLPIFERVCREIDAVLEAAGVRKPNFSWLQIKEKLGSISLYWGRAWASPLVSDFNAGNVSFYRLATIDFDDSLPETERAYVIQEVMKATMLPDAVCDRIREIVSGAEEDAARTCEFCGAPGEHVRLESGMLATACEAHRTREAIAELRRRDQAEVKVAP